MKRKDEEKGSGGSLGEGKRAVKTTIVGGQPPGNERELPPIPVGIEELLAMAAVDPDFADALYARREAAIEASGVELAPTERRILAAVDEPSLRRMVARVDGAVPETDRRSFLGRSAAALLALVGGPALAAACDKKPQPTKGIRPDRPPPKEPAPPPKKEPAAPPMKAHPVTGIRPDPPPAPPAEPVDAGAAPAAADASAASASADAGAAPTAADAGAAPVDAGAGDCGPGDVAPDVPAKKPERPRPDKPKPTRGIRPRPDKPRPTKGIRPWKRPKPGPRTNAGMGINDPDRD